MSEPLAGAAQEILRAAIRAVDPRELTASALRRSIGNSQERTVSIIAAGKAAVGMVLGAADVLADTLRGGVVIAPDTAEALPAGITVFAGGHPMPNAEGVRGARVAMQLLAGLPRESHVFALISGGASSLMTFPVDGVSIDDMMATTSALMAAGADIRELNCVRKHLDQLKGGLMARASAGATIRGLVISDVIGDPLDVIASGPLVPDSTTYDDAIGILRVRRVWDVLPPSVSAHLLAGANGEHPETPKPGDSCFANVEIEVIGNNALAVQGAATEARARGFDVEIVDAPISGEARDAGTAFGRRVLQERIGLAAGRPFCIVGGGETTVTVTGSGVGGRNLEFAAAAALEIDGAQGIAIGSIGTDGRDGPTDAAGAIVDGATASRARTAGTNLVDHLANNDTLRALDAAGAVLRTGATGTNVTDVYLAAITPPND